MPAPGSESGTGPEGMTDGVDTNCRCSIKNTHYTMVGSLPIYVDVSLINRDNLSILLKPE